LFALLIEKTGWTIDEITDLTFRQLNLILKGWNSMSGNKEDKREMHSPSVEEMELFNLTSGIEKIHVKKK